MIVYFCLDCQQKRHRWGRLPPENLFTCWDRNTSYWSGKLTVSDDCLSGGSRFKSLRQLIWGYQSVLVCASMLWLCGDFSVECSIFYFTFIVSVDRLPENFHPFWELQNSKLNIFLNTIHLHQVCGMTNLEVQEVFCCYQCVKCEAGFILER